MKKIYLAFLWHQHQPAYKNPLTNIYELPWVRLHAVKDYYDMVAALEDFPKIKANFNLVPSLLVQLADYAAGTAKDKFTEYTLKKASDLTLDDKVFILMNFFMANWDTMITPYDRYLQLLEKRGRQTSEEEIRKTISFFKTEDFLDLQVWFNLTWVDPYWRKTMPFIGGLFNKGRDFTEEEKQKLIEVHREICGKIVEVHKAAQDRGQIEVSITPFYHPILPLLCDTNAAHEATPDMILPEKRFNHPQDAQWHIENAVKYYEQQFGQKPKGMWPSEGSVSNEAVELIAQNGLNWIATDEAILFASAPEIKGNRKYLFRPHTVSRNGKNINIIFRDHGLSDSIGFVYSKWNPTDAAKDFINKIRGIADYVGDDYEAPLVSVILDGENCWEYYHSDGWDFLTELYKQLSENDSIETVCISDYLTRFPAKNTITNIRAGSWINGNFGIWIGHSEDNLSWKYLGETRDFLEAFLEANPQLKGSENEAKAWETLHMAEGSDWNWWYGDDHSSASDATFDFIYRRHLITVYESLGQKPPDHLYKPIKSRVHRSNIIMPDGLINPVIDGKVSNYFEWKNAGLYEAGQSGGSMHQVSTVIKAFNFGFNLTHLFIMFDLNVDALSKQIEDFTFNIIFLAPQQKKVSAKFDMRGNTVEFICSDVKSEAQTQLDVKDTTSGKVIELALNLETAGITGDYKSLEFVVSVEKNAEEVERWPYQSSIVLPKPSADYDLRSWTI